MNMTEERALYPDPVRTAEEIRVRIREELGFTVNIGVSSNKLLAKMASDFEKPDRVHTLFPDEIEGKMWKLPVSELFFVGRATSAKLFRLGIYTIGQLAASDPMELEDAALLDATRRLGKNLLNKSGKIVVVTGIPYHGVSFADAAGPAAFVTRIRAILLRDTGATLSPFHSFLFLQGLETLSLRVERHTENALKVVDYLKKNPKVAAVNHPSVSDDPEQRRLYNKYFPNGGGSIFTFEIKGDAETAKKFIYNLSVFSLLANVADVKSLVIHPASTTHAQLNEAELLEQGIKPNTIRLSIGTEHIDDIIEDLETAFAAI